MKLPFKLLALRGNVQGDLFALLTNAPTHTNALIIPLLRVMRVDFKLNFVPTRSGGMEH